MTYDMSDQKDELRFLLESNAIEKVYDLDSLDFASRAWDIMKKEKKMDTQTILDAHYILMLDKIEEKYQGAFRDCDVYIGYGKALAPELVEQAMMKFVSEINQPYSGANHQPAGDFFRMHHVNFERIHPFIDGNGRIGRMLYNWQRLHNGYPIHVINESEKYDYYRWFE